jgi:hypothetical protein
MKISINNFFQRNRSMKIFKRILIGFFSMIFILIAAFLIWSSFYYKATDEALLYLNSNPDVEVHINRNIVFMPNKPKETAFIFYPGGKVDEKAYAYLGHEIASIGYPVIIAKMPFRLAVLQPNTAGNIIDSFPEIDTWVIGGHSLGGAMASVFSYNNPDKISGLILMASYPASSNDFSFKEIKVLSIYGSNDKIINQENFTQTRHLLPKDTAFIALEGANHSQFGDYGFQKNDGKADILKSTQQSLIVEAVIDFLQRIE